MPRPKSRSIRTDIEIIQRTIASNLAGKKIDQNELVSMVLSLIEPAAIRKAANRLSPPQPSQKARKPVVRSRHIEPSNFLAYDARDDKVIDIVRAENAVDAKSIVAKRHSIASPSFIQVLNERNCVSGQSRKDWAQIYPSSHLAETMGRSRSRSDVE